MNHYYLCKQNFIPNSHCDFSFDKCLSCCSAKSTKLPFPLSTSRSTTPFDLIHSDIGGHAPVLSRRGFKFYIIFIDDYSRFTWIYFLRSKSEVAHVF